MFKAFISFYKIIFVKKPFLDDQTRQNRRSPKDKEPY
jgi:hypothetical protein